MFDLSASRAPTASSNRKTQPLLHTSKGHHVPQTRLVQLRPSGVGNWAAAHRTVVPSMRVFAPLLTNFRHEARRPRCGHGAGDVLSKIYYWKPLHGVGPRGRRNQHPRFHLRLLRARPAVNLTYNPARASAWCGGALRKAKACQSIKKHAGKLSADKVHQKVAKRTQIGRQAISTLLAVLGWCSTYDGVPQLTVSLST